MDILSAIGVYKENVTEFNPEEDIYVTAHIISPSFLQGDEPINLAEFTDTAIPTLLTRLLRMGVNERAIIAKIAGGAQMFSFVSTSEIMRIGPRNVEACKTVLKTMKIPLYAEDTGGNWGRTLELDCVTGQIKIKSFNRDVKVI